MNKLTELSYCYGCSVCASACPKGCITMHTDTEGFYRPKVNEEACVNCSLCTAVCAFYAQKVAQNRNFKIQNYAVWSKNSYIRNRCTSGGVSFEIGRYLIQKGFKAIVCKYNPETKHAEHYMAKTEFELEQSIGSKYIQSNAFPGFSQIKKGNKYFITGTPCQIDSIRRWTHKCGMEQNVILLDFFCHGVPSDLMWQQYLREIETEIGEFSEIAWRNKETGWHDSWVMKVGDRYSSWFSRGDLFYQMFLGNRCLGRQCYHDCKYKYNRSAADIRIGDLWGRKYAKDENGVNGVICFTQEGANLLAEMKDILHIVPSSIEIVTEAQMKQCAHKPISHMYVMKSLKEKRPLAEIHAKASRIEILERVPNKIKYYFLRIPSKVLEVVGLKTKPLL